MPKYEIWLNAKGELIIVTSRHEPNTFNQDTWAGGGVRDFFGGYMTPFIGGGDDADLAGYQRMKLVPEGETSSCQ